MRVVELPRGSLLYKRSHKAINVLPTSGFVWFARELGYGSDDTYGPIISTWKARRALRLLNISRESDRDQFRDLGGDVVSCNTQYSGGADNERFHLMILPFLIANKLDGTYIDEREADEECAGATEVVLRMKTRGVLLDKL